MTASIGKLGAGPACETGKLIVQVIGKEHPASQKLVIYDDKDSQQQEWLTKQDKPENLADELCSSVLHVWDWSWQPKRHLWLEIASQKGSPIRVPLCDDLRVTPRQADAQWNQVVPVLPLTALRGAKSPYDLGAPVLCRPGYLYVFYRDKLWRELEIRTDSDKTLFHDIDVARYRTGQGFKPEVRQATGQGLEDIWLPARWNDRDVSDLRLCYSEIQLGAARLNFLERHPDELARRCQSFRLQASSRVFKDLYRGKPDGAAMLEHFSQFDARDSVSVSTSVPAQVARLNLDHRAFPLSLVAPQRARAQIFEYLLEHPARYLCDLSGQFPDQEYRRAMAFLNQGMLGEKTSPTHLLELSAVADALSRSLKTAQPPAGEAAPPEEDVWQAQPGATDVLAQVRPRQLCGVLLDDARYRIRHLESRIDNHRQLLQVCARHAATQPNHGSALLVQQLVVARTLQGKPNPLHKEIDKLSRQGLYDINRNTAVLERIEAWQGFMSAQNLLREALEQTRSVATLADHLSLEGFQYLGALHATTRTLACLALNPAQVDPLAPTGDLNDATGNGSPTSPRVSEGQKFLAKLQQDTQSALHRMLWPDVDEPQLCKAHEPKPDAPNPGTGQFRGEELAKLENAVVPPADNWLTLDETLLGALIAGASLDSFLTLSGKNLNGALMSVFDTLQGAMEVAQDALDNVRQLSSQASANANATQQAAKSADARLAQTRRQLGRQGRPITLGLHGPGLQQLRSMLPGTFGYAVFVRRNQFDKTTHYLFGMEDLPTRPRTATRYYGEYLSPQGKVLGSTDRQRIQGDDIVKGDHWVIAIPRNHSTARLVGEMNKRLTAAQAADAAAEVAAREAQVRGAALSEAVGALQGQKNARAYRILNSTPFSTAVLMLEMWNVRAEWNAWDQNEREKSPYRGIAGLSSAALDLLIALEAISFKFAGSQAVLAIARSTLFEIPEPISRTLGSLRIKIVERVTGRLVLQFIAGIIFSGVSLYDAWYAWQWHDQAMYGYLLMASGALIGAAGGWLAGSATFLGLTPAGWLCLLLVGAGAGLVYALSSTPLQDWLSNGPFGEGQGEKAAHLLNSDEAFYRLVGVLANIRISIQPNPRFEPAAKLDVNEPIPFRVRQANTLIRLESALPGLLANLGNVDIHAECRLRPVHTVNVKGEAAYTEVRSATHEPPRAPLAQRLFPDALELYFQTPVVHVLQPHKPEQFLAQRWAVRAQFILQGGGQNRIFPTPGIKAATVYGPEYAKPDFGSTGRPFWADEQTNQAST
ncbi:hypothetical protein [Pseudomonas citronellolis]|uniref:hypothetical protein n=1 Tax=Pseudomonas citronellolis TaxID=53408 RepID=UPI0021BE0767|nr:hypothetical protein [Pseudomonas citronellolis]UXJ52215.1 hypothetical protein N5P21_30465 [Pseudomonas citronellolis]